VTEPQTRTKYLYDVANTNGVVLLNPIGRLSLSNTAIVESLYSYDPLGRVTADYQTTPEHNTSAFLLNYAYDLAGNMTSFTNGVGVTFTQTFDAAGRATQLMSSLVDSQHPATLATTDSSVGYYPHGALRKMTFGNGLTLATEIEARLQTCEINLNSSSSPLTACGVAPSGTIQDHHYGLGSWGSTNNGDITSWIASGTQNFNRSYSYDSLNRLSTLSSPSDPNGCTGLSWTYDAWGNRTNQTVTGGTCQTFAQSANTQNQLVGPPYLYDAAGNMTYDGSHTYTYDAENRLIQVDGTVGTCSTATACYTYDASGVRVEKSTSAGEFDYLYDLSGNDVTVWLTNTGGSSWLTGNVYFNGGLAAEYFGGTTYFVHQDHLGSTRLVTALNQSIVQNLDYLPFGELNSADSGITTHEFTGDERDAETDLAHAQFRQYSSSYARWMTPDPTGLGAVDPTNPQSWNRYVYVFNNPLVLSDPAGLIPACLEHVCSEGGSGGPGDSSGGGGSCTVDRIDVPCSIANGILQSGAGIQCPGGYCGPYVGNNGYIYLLSATTEGLNFVNPLNGDLFSDGSELGLPALEDPLGLFADNGSGNPSSGSNNAGCIVPRVLAVIPTAHPTGTGQNQGGHQQANFTFSGNLSSFAPITSSAFSVFGINNGYRFGGVLFSLHVNSVTFNPVTNTTSFQGHEDIFNPATGLFGLLGHTVVDLGIGTLFFNHSSSLDRKCP
jgi:RHS repeat-associated protein